MTHTQKKNLLSGFRQNPGRYSTLVWVWVSSPKGRKMGPFTYISRWLLQHNSDNTRPTKWSVYGNCLFAYLSNRSLRATNTRAARDIFSRITAQDRNIILLAQFISCVINIHFVTVYDAIISPLWFTVISIYSVKAYQGLISRHWQLTPRCVNG